MLISLMSWKGDFICVCLFAHPIAVVGTASPTLLLCYIFPVPHLPVTLLQHFEAGTFKLPNMKELKIGKELPGNYEQLLKLQATQYRAFGNQ